MSDVFIVDLFYFQINKNITRFLLHRININIKCMTGYTKHMLFNILHVFYIYNKNNLHHFSIFYNISIFSATSLCVSKCVAWKYSLFISDLELNGAIHVIMGLNRVVFYHQSCSVFTWTNCSYDCLKLALVSIAKFMWLTFPLC